MLCIFRVAAEGKAGKEIPQLLISKFLKEFSASNVPYQMQKITPLGH